MTADLREYRDVISVIIRYENLYARYSKKTGDFGTGFQVSLFDIQVPESVYLNEDNFMKMTKLAEQLGMT